MTLERNEWVVIRDLSLATYAREAGFDLAVFDSYSNVVQEELRRRAINRAVNSIKEDFWDRDIDIEDIKQGIYVISLSSPLSICYRDGHSQIIYIGLGNLMNRIKSHFEITLFDFMQGLSGANFDFHFAYPGRRNCTNYHKHVEWQMLEEFKGKFGGLHDDRPYPILNKNAGSRQDIDDRSNWWKKPLRNNGKTLRWMLQPTSRSHFTTLA